MKSEKNDNLYKFSIKNPWQFSLVVILYLIGAVSIPGNLFEFVLGNSIYGNFLSQLLVKILCSVMPIWLIFEIKAEKLFSFKGFFSKFYLLIPFLFVVINNFPIIAIVEKQAFLINCNFVNWLTYLFAVLSGVLLEELTFRGLIFTTLLRKFQENKNRDFLAVLISSSMFGIVHIVNLLSGASLGGVIMQIGYSFLIGGMCAITLLKTGNFYNAVLMHFIFNIGGLLLNNNMISGNIWTTAEIIVTAVLGVIVTIYALYMLLINRTNKINDKIIIKN